MMGYETPNIDRIAREGIEFTDFYAQQSCTAGRAAFITGQNPVRTGLTAIAEVQEVGSGPTLRGVASEGDIPPAPESMSIE